MFNCVLGIHSSPIICPRSKSVNVPKVTNSWRLSNIQNEDNQTECLYRMSPTADDFQIFRIRIIKVFVSPIRNRTLVPFVAFKAPGNVVEIQKKTHNFKGD